MRVGPHAMDGGVDGARAPWRRLMDALASDLASQNKLALLNSVKPSLWIGRRTPRPNGLLMLIRLRVCVCARIRVLGFGLQPNNYACILTPVPVAGAR